MSKSSSTERCRVVSRRWIPVVGFTLAIAAFCLAAPDAARGDLGTDLQLYSSMDNYTPLTPPAYWEDVSGNDHVTLTNPPAYDGTGDIGGANRGTAVDLSDGSLRMTVDDGLNSDFDPGTSDYSVSLWYNSISSASSCLLSKGNTVSATAGYSLRLASGEPLLRMNNVDEADDTKVSLYSGLGDLTGTGWHHLVGVFDRSGSTYGTADQVLFYVDNQLTASTVLPDVFLTGYTIANATTEFIMGGQNESGTAYNLNGYLDDVAVYRGAISATQVNTLYTASTLDASTLSGVTPVAIHNFVTNRNQGNLATMADDYGSHEGVLVGTATQATDPIRGKVLDITDPEGGRSTDYLTYGDVLDPMDSDYTVSFWFKLDSDGFSPTLVAKGSNYSSGDGGWKTSYITADGAIFVRGNHGDDGAKIGFRKPIDRETFFGEWHHMAMVIDQDEGVIKAYLDGVGSYDGFGLANGWELINDTYVYTFTPGDVFQDDSGNPVPCNDLTVGGGKAGDPLGGQVDDLAIWTRALTEAEILGIFDGTLTIPTAPDIPGDTNGDQVVDATDAATLADNWGADVGAGGFAAGDFNDDGVVDAADAAILAANWGDHNPPPASGAEGVPEPGALVLLAGLAGLVLTLRGRRG